MTTYSHHLILGVFKNKHQEEYSSFMEVAREFSNLKFVTSYNFNIFNNNPFNQKQDIDKWLEHHEWAILIIRKQELVVRTVEPFTLYNDIWIDLKQFVLQNFLIDIDFLTSSSLPIYYGRKKPIGIVTLPHSLDAVQDQDKLNFYISSMSNKLYAKYSDKMDFALMNINEF
mmetsp:Transcript_26679/g.25709  ORF Transcript_26679/g.25709 Transcript_26679/m.25709 type:complete len:171 (-) Transcript_26679:616-1128(-)